MSRETLILLDAGYDCSLLLFIAADYIYDAAQKSGWKIYC